MSIPPSQTPPGGFSQAPPPPNNSGGCWKAAGITCSILLVLAIIVGIVAFNAVKRGYEHHSGIFGQIVNVSTATQDGFQLRQAILKYHQQHGHYPNTLIDVVSDGLVDGKILHTPLDTNPNPGHISWTYFKPAENAPNSTPILSEHYQLTLGGAGSSSTQGSDITITLGGGTSGSAGTTYHTN